MLLKKILRNSRTSYSRIFESMGKGLLLIRVECPDKSRAPFHYLFENGWKPPFDIAINPSKGVIDYFKFFLQDEKVVKSQRLKELESIEGDAVIEMNQFSTENYQFFIQAEFEACFKDDSLCLLRIGETPNKKIAISKNTFVLFTSSNEFAGVILDEISGSEINEMVMSEVIN